MNVIPKFGLLSREACKASIMLEGLTGKGKSGLALMIAYGLVGGFKPKVTAEQSKELFKKIFAIDAENRSLNLFIGIPASWGGTFHSFYGGQLTSADGYAPSNYLAYRDVAVKANAEVVIEDSITHMWIAKGGVLDIVNEVKAADSKMDNYRVWGNPAVMQEKQNLIDTIRDPRCHVITTVRVKEKYDLQKGADEKNQVVSLGEQQLQQEGLKYEPDLVLHMIQAGSGNTGSVRHPKAKVLKSRYAILTEGEEYEFTPQLCEQLRQYLAEGIDPQELLEAQRKDYVDAIKNLLDTRSGVKAIWTAVKQDAGVKDVKLEEIPLDVLKKLFTQISAE